MRRPPNPSSSYASEVGDAAIMSSILAAHQGDLDLARDQ